MAACFASQVAARSTGSRAGCSVMVAATGRGWEASLQPRPDEAGDLSLRSLLLEWHDFAFPGKRERKGCFLEARTSILKCLSFQEGCSYLKLCPGALFPRGILQRTGQSGTCDCGGGGVRAGEKWVLLSTLP